MALNAQYYTAAELISTFDRVFGARLIFCGYERIAPRKWAFETGKGFKYLFQLASWKTGTACYSPCGAVSLDFVPRITYRAVKMRTALKYAEVHHSIGDAKWNWQITPDRDGFDERLERIASESVPTITASLESFKSVSDVCASIEREKSGPKAPWFYHYPLQFFAFAFCLARLGREADARHEFARVVENPFFDEDHHEEIKRLFEAEIASAEGSGGVKLQYCPPKEDFE